MSDQPQHVCCFHVTRSDTFGDHRTEVADCCWCQRYRVTKYELASAEGHGPRAPRVLVKMSERIVE